jgi:hypothetical protein
MPNINEVKKMKNTEKITQELLLLLLVYLKIQIAAESMRLEELQHWAGIPCTCPTCEDDDEKVETDDKATSFSQEFKEEWE